MAEARRSCPSPCPRTLLSSEKFRTPFRLCAGGRRESGEPGQTRTARRPPALKRNEILKMEGLVHRAGPSSSVAGRAGRGGTPERRDGAARRPRGGTRRWDGG